MNLNKANILFMLAIVLALVFVVRSTPNFSDILTHTRGLYPPVNCHKNNLTKLI